MTTEKEQRVDHKAAKPENTWPPEVVEKLADALYCEHSPSTDPWDSLPVGIKDGWRNEARDRLDDVDDYLVPAHSLTDADDLARNRGVELEAALQRAEQAEEKLDQVRARVQEQRVRAVLAEAKLKEVRAEVKRRMANRAGRIGREDITAEDAYGEVLDLLAPLQPQQVEQKGDWPAEVELVIDMCDDPPRLFLASELDQGARGDYDWREDGDYLTRRYVPAPPHPSNSQEVTEEADDEFDRPRHGQVWIDKESGVAVGVLGVGGPEPTVSGHWYRSTELDDFAMPVPEFMGRFFPLAVDPSCIRRPDSPPSEVAEIDAAEFAEARRDPRTKELLERADAYERSLAERSEITEREVEAAAEAMRDIEFTVVLDEKLEKLPSYGGEITWPELARAALQAARRVSQPSGADR